jgi:hypothetical protein
VVTICLVEAASGDTAVAARTLRIGNAGVRQSADAIAAQAIVRLDVDFLSITVVSNQHCQRLIPSRTCRAGRF